MMMPSYQAGVGTRSRATITRPATNFRNRPIRAS
jgi:hypothetical protein